MSVRLARHPARVVRFLIAALVIWEYAPTLSDAASPHWEERDVAIAAEDVVLRASLVLPAGNHRTAGILLLPGSGPTDRDGNQPQFHNDLIRRLALDLAGSGFATLRADKRGIGGSRLTAMREQDLRFDDYVEDAVRWLEFLRSQPRISSVFVIGHSEGALIAIVAAQRTSVDGLVSIAGAGFPLGTVLRRQIDASGWPSSLSVAAGRVIDELEAGRLVGDVPPELAPVFRASVQPYLISQFRYDPAVEIAKLHVPILIIQGDRDLQISEADAERLAAAAPQADVALLLGVNHVLRDSPPDRGGNVALYNMPQKPLVATVLPSVASFIRHAARPAQ